MKPVSIDQLSEEALDRFPLWEFVDPRGDEPSVVVAPVQCTSVKSFSNRVAACFAVLRNGAKIRALVGNIDTTNERAMQHFLTLSLRVGRAWVHLARYHDVDYDEHGPEALAKQLGLSIEEVFPIEVDLRALHVDRAPCLRRSITAAPASRLSTAELVALALPKEI